MADKKNSNYAAVVKSAVSTLNDIIELKQDKKEPFKIEVLYFLLTMALKNLAKLKRGLRLLSFFHG